jgi:putative PIN family toxin of toxin-antitoxin system
MRILFDTNVIISAFITSSSSYEIFNYCLKNHKNFISDFIISEVKEKFLNKFKYDENIVKNVILFLKKNLIIVEHGMLREDICKDRDDDNILAAALTAKADCIITGDSDLLELCKYENILIISPKDFRRFEKEYNKSAGKLPC